MRAPLSSLVAAKGLSVRYGNVQALAPLDLELPRGVWALLGPNGAGKSTLIRALLGLTRPASGSVRVLGEDPFLRPAAVRGRVGYMPESAALLPGLTGVQYVALAARLNGLPTNQARRRAHVSLDEVGLGEARYRPVEGYSMGMRQRVKLAQAIAHEPELLILDEPTNGLDPMGRESMLDFIRGLGESGVSLILSSHILPEVRRVCDQAVIIRGGKVLHRGPLADLQTELGGMALETLDPPGPLIAGLKAAGFSVDEMPFGLVVHGDADVPTLLSHAARAGVTVRSARPHQRDVQDVVVDLMEVDG